MFNQLLYQPKIVSITASVKRILIPLMCSCSTMNVNTQMMNTVINLHIHK